MLPSGEIDPWQRAGPGSIDPRYPVLLSVSPWGYGHSAGLCPSDPTRCHRKEVRSESKAELLSSRVELALDIL
jgi:hypothetical protein